MLYGYRLVPFLTVLASLVIPPFAFSVTPNLDESYDDWCKDHCPSFEACSERFSDNYVDLQVKIGLNEEARNIGIGQDLVFDAYFGKTIARQTFHTQFVLDVAAAVGISPCRLYIRNISSYNRDIVVTFRLYSVDVTVVQNLTKIVQQYPESDLYSSEKKVSKFIDHSVGLVVHKWDLSLILKYNIGVIEGVAGTQREYLNEGGERWCEDNDYPKTAYCDFEWQFREDIANALHLDSSALVEVLMIRSMGRDSVLVSFRFIPRQIVESASWISALVSELNRQVEDLSSLLYLGNVTVRSDSTWGVSGNGGSPRYFSPYLPYDVLPTNDDEYERCKSTQRCNRAWSFYEQHHANVTYTTQAFPGGEHFATSLFANFEDWRQGTYGWQSIDRDIDTLNVNGAYWSPFYFDAIGPSVPSYNSSSNNGLVLNNTSLISQIHRQKQWINKLDSYITWLRNFKETATLDALRRSRRDVHMDMNQTLHEYQQMKTSEEQKLVNLSNSQCSLVKCTILFNTSNLEMSGAINATGVVETYEDGSEVAVWAFDSVNIGSEVTIQLYGQRAMMIVSRSSLHIDTPFYVEPGTLGGFPGGFSAARHINFRFQKVCDKADYSLFNTSDEVSYFRCKGDIPIHEVESNLTSNNVNGLGSSSVRVYLMTIETIAPVVEEVQKVVVDAHPEESLSGGFVLHFHGYSTLVLNYDITPIEMKRNIEESMNGVDVATKINIDRTNYTAGIGRVEVSRTSIGSSGGFSWSITFSSAIGNLGKIKATSYLTGRNASVLVETIRDGNEIGGTFQLEFMGDRTRQLAHNISASDMELVLVSDISSVLSAHVVRTDPIGNCWDGLCDAGPTQSGGFVWTVTLSTRIGNKSPSAPTSDEFDREELFSEMTAISSLSGCHQTICPEIDITNGHGKSHVLAMRQLGVSKPFSFAYGGTGGSFGGLGGQGYGINPPGPTYGDIYNAHLYGGSGGGAGYFQPFETKLFGYPNGRGGEGGGAVGFVALNDIYLGSAFRLTVDGGNGQASFLMGGGGGSGGSILLSAGGSLQLHGNLSAKGGNGGNAIAPQEKRNIRNGHGAGGSGGRIALYANSIYLPVSSDNITVTGGGCKSQISETSDLICDGEDGTIHTDTLLSSSVFVDQSTGAMGTNASLFLKNTNYSSSLNHCQQNVKYGPTYAFKALQRPGRISFFVKLSESSNQARLKQNISFLSSGLAFEMFQDSTTNLDNRTRAVFGIFLGKEVRHGSYYLGVKDNCFRHLKSLETINKKVTYNRWLKVDIRFHWEDTTYDILFDDLEVINGAKFSGEGIKYIQVKNSHPNVITWFDELYVGDDLSMNFRCPFMADREIQMDRPLQTGWKASDIGPESTYHEMQRHESHLSRRNLYNRPDNGNLSPFDGDAHLAYHSDIKFKYPSGDHPNIKGSFALGALTKVTDPKTKNNYYVWYGEHNNAHTKFDDYMNIESSIHGGVFSCSSYDLIEWKNEGMMLNYSNITDMVGGSEGPFHVERPRVIYNKLTRKFVMWMIVDNANKSLGMAGVAISDYANGPFDFVRSFYPDGNETRDQHIYVEDDKENSSTTVRAFLIRSYYATVEYVLPTAVMQPIWESVKNSDGSTNFALTYHRAHYEPGYDNYHDIYLQRWRKEDIPWKVICVNRVTGVERIVPYGEEHLNRDKHVCNHPEEYKLVLGTGNPTTGEVQSRFLDPSDPKNNAWKPNSVPLVKAQSWFDNYRDSECGLEKLDKDLDSFEINVDFDEIIDSENGCMPSESNIADNPIHPTLPDKRVGPKQTVQSRRAKFVAISKLTDDYLDTSGITRTFEGELENNADIGDLILSLFGPAKVLEKQKDQGFEWVDDSSFADNSTPVSRSESPALKTMDNFGFKSDPNWNTEFHQYEENVNDRSHYSLSCVIDGNCPVD